MSNKREAPTKSEIALLEPFSGLPLESIVVPETAQQFAVAAADLASCRYVGFDTESKPTFKPGEVSAGPHVVQLTTLDKAYIFQLHRTGCCEVVGQLIESSDIVKVGFGLKSDRSLLRRKLGITPRAILDMNVVFRRDGFRKEIGVRTAVAVVFSRKFQKSKTVTMSNWAKPILKPNQLLYAANDAYAAVKILDALNKPEHALPIMDLNASKDENLTVKSQRSLHTEPQACDE